MRSLCVLAFVASMAVPAAVSADEVSSALVDSAVAIQASLAKDSMAGVQANAATIEEQAVKLGPPAAKIAEAAKELKAATKIGDARTAFGKTNEAIVQYIESQKLSLDPKVRIAVCPMVNKPWLQRDGPIQNPYYGTEMPTCGSFKK